MINMDRETGIRYGVTNASNYMRLYEEIMNYGEMEEDIPPSNEENEDEDDYDSYTEAQSEARKVLEKNGGDTRYLLDYLGGAPIIFVLKSTKVVRCRVCSPCVPNAGDLDNLDMMGVETYAVEDADKDEEE